MPFDARSAYLLNPPPVPTHLEVSEGVWQCRGEKGASIRKFLRFSG